MMGDVPFEHHPELTYVPVSVLVGLSLCISEVSVPICKGVSYNYETAIASTLQNKKLDHLTEENLSKILLNEQVIKVLIKASAGGLGKISVYNEKQGSIFV